MKEISINCNTKGSIIIDDYIKLNGVNIVLLDDKNIPIARYEFCSVKVSNLTIIPYADDSVKIHFDSDVQPTMRYESTTLNNIEA